MKRKKQRKKGLIPCFLFTLDTLTITQDALKLLEKALPQAQQSSKLAFAEETMKQVQTKLDTMRKSVGALCLLTFDQNEKIIIAMAMQLYIFDLTILPSGCLSERKLKQCKQIERFASGHLT